MSWMTNPKVDESLEKLSGTMTAEDFLDLALACLDQAGLSNPAQERIERAIRKEVQS